MNTTTDRMEQVQIVDKVEIVELGEVSEETKGSPFGHQLDGGFGRQLP